MVMSKQGIAAAMLMGVVVARHPVNEQVYNELRAMDQGNNSWSFLEPSQNPLAKLSEKELIGMMGTRLPEPASPEMKRNRANFLSGAPSDLPEKFDARDKFGSCIHPIRDQKNCGSCWAFAAAEALSDNLCVAGLTHDVLSPQELVSCDTACNGCDGGTLPGAWDYLVNTGLPSDSCEPYTADDGVVDKCPYSCPSGGDYTKHKCPSAYNNPQSAEEIKSSVYQLGSGETGFFVYEDFTAYTGGIYTYKTGRLLGGHAVKIVGWGTGYLDGDEVPYWLVANSWGAAWGESGYFRIAFDSGKADFATMGVYNCGDIAPPAPTPAPAPACEDIVPANCVDITPDKCKILHIECAKSCKCCDYPLPPDYCDGAMSVNGTAVA